MAAFLLADVLPEDMEAYKASGYLEAVPEIAARFGGVYRARGGEMELLEGEWQPRRMVIIEFPSMADLKAFYACADYQPYKRIRHSLADSRMVALEGLGP